MYRELIISAIIVISIFIFDVFTQKYTYKSINDAIQDIEEIKQSITKKQIQSKNAYELCSKKYEKWMEYHKLLAFYIEHNELEKVETSYVVSKSYIQVGNYEDAIVELEKTKFVMQHINEKYSVNLKNIF